MFLYSLRPLLYLPLSLKYRRFSQNLLSVGISLLLALAKIKFVFFLRIFRRTKTEERVLSQPNESQLSRASLRAILARAI